MIQPSCCDRTMLVLHRTPGRTTWWCVRCGSHCGQANGEAPQATIAPVMSKLPLAFAGRVAGLLHDLADAIEAGRVHYVNVADNVRTLASLIECQGEDRRKLLQELGLPDGR